MNRYLIEIYKQRLFSKSNRTNSLLASIERANELANKVSNNSYRHKSLQDRKYENLAPEYKSYNRYIPVEQKGGVTTIQDLNFPDKILKNNEVISQSDSIGAQTQTTIDAMKAHRDRIGREDQAKFVEKYGQEALDKAQEEGSRSAKTFMDKRSTDRLRATDELGVDTKNISQKDAERLRMLQAKKQSDFEKWDSGEISDPKGTSYTPEEEKILNEPKNRTISSSGVDVTNKVSADVGFDTDMAKSRTERVLAQSERAGRMAEKVRLFR